MLCRHQDDSESKKGPTNMFSRQHELSSGTYSSLFFSDCNDIILQ